MDGRLIHKEKVAFSNENGYVWTGPKTYVQLSNQKPNILLQGLFMNAMSLPLRAYALNK